MIEKERISSSSIEQALSRVAVEVANRHVRNHCLLGLGSGSAVARFAKALGERVTKDSMNVTVIPSSMQAWLLARENGLDLYKDSSHCPSKIDVCVDGADQVSPSERSMIKGGGGALLKEKIILSSSKEAYILADETKFVRKLSRQIPVEVVQFAIVSVEQKLRDQFGAQVELRKLDKGYPYYTESGNIILDCKFHESIENAFDMEKRLKTIPGVVECGIFNVHVTNFYKASQDGSFSRT